MSLPVLILVLVFAAACSCGVVLVAVGILLEFALEAKEAVEGRLDRREIEERDARREEARAYAEALGFKEAVAAYEQRRAEQVGAEAEAWLAEAPR